MLYVVLLNLTEELQRQYDVDTILARDVEINWFVGGFISHECRYHVGD